MTTRALASSAVAAVLLVSRAASAQQAPTAPDSPSWLHDLKEAQGIGVKTGDLELHPGIAAEFGYDSNYLLRSDTVGVSNGPPLSPVIPALELRVTPSLYLSTISKTRVEEEGGGLPSPLAFRVGLNATYRELIGVGSDASSSGPNDLSQQRNVSGAADARLDILPERPWSGSLFATYTRAILPNTVDANPDISFNSDTVSLGAEIAAQPGSGTLDWHLGYRLTDTIFEESAGAPYDNIDHEFYTRGRWKFRPRTALVYDATFRFLSYDGSDKSAAAVGLDTSTPVRTRIGIDGLITDRFGFLGMIGWGASFYDPNEGNPKQFDSIIAQAELRWFLSASPGMSDMKELGLTLSSIALGYTRDFQNSYLGSYYTQDRGYLNFNYLFAGRVVVTLGGGVAAIEYPDLVWADGTPRNPSFTDIRADATLFGEYRFTDTFAINATVSYTANISNTVLPIAESKTPSPPADTYAMEWKRVEAFLGLRLFL